eukprot:TRINITY_DN709_c1_g1_i1.p1 TRINITY_DN709_c1_g1~~TRINITY_DN709_c1_g1_i1.p1  ORF type:complete len:650 (-),score=137.94 TRINITY_DN709_c1_g1_i1:113-1846(-)
MENLISDQNRSVATLAITTLLKVEHEGSVERLMKQISNFINDISDEFKIVVVDAIKTLAMKYPDKHFSIMNFLSTMLRDEGGFEYKSSIVSTILTIIEKVPQSTDMALDHLCEFIEDCEYTYLSTKILYLLGKLGPKSMNPSRYIRYIYNRIALENAQVRASAVTALSKFGINRPDLRHKITVLLRRSLQDSDDEVRDRATFYLRALQSMNGTTEPPSHPSEHIMPLARTLMIEVTTAPIDNIQGSLLSYLEHPSDVAFNITTVSVKPKAATTQSDNARHMKAGGGAPDTDKKPLTVAPKASYAQQLAAVPQLEKLGDLLNSSSPIDLTESEGVSAAYHVTLTKHFFVHHVVLQYSVVNTLSEQMLKDVSVEIGAEEDNGFVVQTVIPVPEAVYNETADVYAVLLRPPVQMGQSGVKIPTCTFWNNLLFKTHEIDQKTNHVSEDGFPDEFPLDDVEIKVGDYVRKNYIPNFTAVWTQTDNDPQSVATFSLTTVNNIKDGIEEIIKVLGMSPCENSEKLGDSKTKHILYLSGTFMDGNIPVIARVRIRLSPQQVVGMELTVRSPNIPLAESLANIMFA